MNTSAAPTPGARCDRLLTVPNVLSLLRLASVPVFLYLFVSGRELAAVAVYAGGAISDFFDGVVARRFGQISQLGKLLDPLADRVLIVALVVALVARDAFPLWLAVVIVARDLLVLSLFPLLERRGVQRIEVRFVGKSATASLLFGLTWLAASFVWEGIGEQVGLAFASVGAVLYWAAAFLYAREARQKFKALGEREGVL